MNDVTEPFVVNKTFGGTGIDYHGITQASSMLASYVLNETGFGKVFQTLQDRNKSIERKKRKEIYNIKDMVKYSAGHPRFAENWKITLSYLDRIYDLAKSNDIKVVLLIFPHTFQLMNDQLQNPQKILLRHAKQKGADIIDFTTIFEKLIFNDDAIELLMEKDLSYEEIYKLYEHRMRRYFLDEDHYTVIGHKIIASRLYKYLSLHDAFDRN